MIHRQPTGEKVRGCALSSSVRASACPLPPSSSLLTVHILFIKSYFSSQESSHGVTADARARGAGRRAGAPPARARAARRRGRGAAWSRGRREQYSSLDCSAQRTECGRCGGWSQECGDARSRSRKWNHGASRKRQKFSTGGAADGEARRSPVALLDQLRAPPARGTLFAPQRARLPSCRLDIVAAALCAARRKCSKRAD